MEPATVAPAVPEAVEESQLPTEGAMEAGAPDALAVDSVAPAPVETPPEGAFRIDPELARSIGLPLADRIKLYRMLGFRTVVSQREVTIEEEGTLWWTWRGREKPGHRGGKPGGQGRPAGLHFERRRNDAEPGQKRPTQHRRKEKPSSSKADGRSKPREQRSDAPVSARSTPLPVNNPFGALADLFGSDGPGKGKRG